jgi:hypothetical protein
MFGGSEERRHWPSWVDCAAGAALADFDARQELGLSRAARADRRRLHAARFHRVPRPAGAQAKDHYSERYEENLPSSDTTERHGGWLAQLVEAVPFQLRRLDYRPNDTQTLRPIENAPYTLLQTSCSFKFCKPDRCENPKHVWRINLINPPFANQRKRVRTAGISPRHIGWNWTMEYKINKRNYGLAGLCRTLLDSNGADSMSAIVV